MTLIDLEQIRHNVVDIRSRALVTEVVRCYEGGAYRAALVSLWVAVVADLTGKIRHLADSGDGEALKVIGQFDKALDNQSVDKLQKYERNILSTAEKQLGILLPREREELERLNQDRNLCAHPSYLDGIELFAPDAELVRAHLVAANRCVFSQRALAGKRLITMLEAEITGESWPKEPDYFLDRFFTPARDSVKKNMAKIIIKQSLRPQEGSNRIAQRALGAALSIEKNSPLLFEHALSSVLNAWEASGSLGNSELIRASGAYGDKSAFWSKLPSTGKTRLKAYLENCDTGTLLDNRFFVSGTPKDTGIAEKFQGILEDMDAEEASKAIKQSINRGSYVQVAIDRVRVSGTFRNAEANLRLVDLCSDELDHADVALLREAIQKNSYSQVRLAGDTESILLSIYTASPRTEESQREWYELAKWLHDTGVKNDDSPYLYDEFLRVVGENE